MVAQSKDQAQFVTPGEKGAFFDTEHVYILYALVYKCVPEQDAAMTLTSINLLKMRTGQPKQHQEHL
jgi:hypothetical protein